MEVQWAEDEKFEETWDQRSMAGSTKQAEVMPKVPELVVHDRMSQGEEMRGTKAKKKVIGWSAEEMRDKPNSPLKEDTGEMMEWRHMSQEEMDQCWKKLAEEMEDSRREVDRGRGLLFGMETCTKEQEGEKIVEKESSFLRRIQRGVQATHA